ncbi:hypothetical protein DICPUDRAFT_91465 [Dictyostelium purpureum]|uniref:Uncharacterized protein n=1 Tax=Dictyostelium purpureum TaxID=5786 RepID=F0ZCV4_DICPU|nr:uncharacterized protein DICPUDRAFT_91465 [Dictyostelium purpureum]EGC38202.1 hypothetical protein DICPUDRAFT_91465 [Dictyostelium purpureum]|eukprot:XP_003285240.1 hypothetical protein DICPUDRAFT_91465 [Dictyostelium purpureum]
MMYDVTGLQVKQYLSWLPIYNITHPVYTFFKVDNPNTNYHYQNSSICDDFVWASFNTFYQLGGSLIGVQSNPDRDEVRLFTDDPPMLVDQNNSTQMNEIAKFYLKMEQIANIKNETLEDMIINILNVFQDTFYIYNDGQYFKMLLDQSKPLDFSYKPSPMPSGPQNPSSIETLSNCYDATNNNNRTSYKIGIAVLSIFIMYIISYFNFIKNLKLKNN